MNINQRKRIMRAFIRYQFGYFSLVWFFCNRKINTRMNRIQERALRIVSQLLEEDSSVSIHIRNAQVLGKKIFKGKEQLISSYSSKYLQNN